MTGSPIQDADVERLARIIELASSRSDNLSLSVLAMFHAARAEAVRAERKRVAERLERMALLLASEGATVSATDMRQALRNFATALEGG